LYHLPDAGKTIKQQNKMKSSNADERLKKMLTALPNREETVNLFELLQRLQDAGITFEQLAKSTIIKLEGDITAPKVINLFVSKLNDNTNQDSPSQRAQIRKHLEGGGTLTAMDALNMFGCWNMKARVHEIRQALQEEGNQFVVITEMIPVSPKKRVARYRIEKK